MATNKKKSNSGLDVDALIANESIVKTDISDEMEDSTLIYALKTIIDRAIPDVRDGMKPVHRRILYGAYEGGYLPNRQYVKNAKIVGDVMGNYHPHGDGSIYDAETSMSQPWKYRYTLIDFHGNNGSIDGDGSAAMRYTEGKLDKKAMYILQDIDSKCVDFKPNYAQNLQEPEVLPSLFPNLLLNGSSGIAMAYTTEIPSHQLGEVVDGIIEVVNNPGCIVDDIMKHIKGPDFPGGAYLLNNAAIKELYETGKASLTFKAKYDVEENHESGNNQIVFTEIPPDVNKPKLVEKIHDICLEKKDIPRVIDVRDESKGNDVRIVVELHKTAVTDIVIRALYEKTPLQKNSSYVMRVIVNKTPRVLNLKEIIEYYIEHRRDVVSRRTKHIKEITEKKLHIQEGLKIVTQDIDAAIDIIKDSDTTDDAKKGLRAKFGLSNEQAIEVLEMKLKQLTKLNKQDLDTLIATLRAEIDEYTLILSGVQEIDKVLIKELKQLKKDLNDERRTKLIDDVQTPTSEAAITSNDPIALVITSKNDIKHITLKALEDMIKNGNLKERSDVFIQGLKFKINDKFIAILDNGDYIKFDFSDLMGGLPIENNRKIISIVTYDDKDKNKAILIMTKMGIIKKVKIEGFKVKNVKQTSCIELQENDEIIGVRVSQLNDNNVITIATRDGLIHRFFEKSFKETAAGGKGINGITLIDNEVVGFDISNSENDDKDKLIVFVKYADNTYGMKTMKLTEFKPKGRMSQGIRGIEFSKKQPGEIDGLVISGEDFFTVNNKGGVTVYKFENLPDHGRYNKPDPIENEISVVKFFLE